MKHFVENPVSWGLPAAYNELPLEGQRLARVAVVRNRSTPADDVRSWHLFREYYLRADPAADHDPGFYDHWVDPAPGHYEWAYVAAAFPRLIETAHRGSAKSTIWSKEFPLRDLVSQPRSINFIILSSDDKIQRHTAFLMRQIASNKRIIADFGVLRPKRTEGLWNHHNLCLTNEAQLVMGTINSMNLRGERPWVITLDDVERDPKPGTDLQKLIDQSDTFFFQVVLPMARAHCKVRLVGTPNNKKTLIWKLQNQGDPRISSARFHNHSYWFFNGPPEPGSGYTTGQPFWPAEYPTQQSIDEKRQELGPEVWNMEMLGEDTAGDAAVFQIEESRNLYSLDDPTAFCHEDPLATQGLMTWNDSTPQADGSVVLVPRQELASKFYSSLYRFITVDYAATVKASSDFSAIQVFGVDRLNQLFSLDMWGGKLLGDDLVDQVWRMARLWKVRVVGVEAVAMQVHFYSRVAERQHMMAQGGWVPQAVPIRYESTKVSKPERILGCRGRFRSGCYKLPAWRRNEKHYKELIAQIQGFNPDVLKGLTGLGNDDHIDTIPMAQELIGSRRAAIINEDVADDPISAIRKGVTSVHGWTPGTLVPLQQLPADCINILMAKAEARPTKGPQIIWESGDF